MIFEMLTGDFLFEPRKGPTFSKNDDHLAQMMELLGQFPKDFCLRGKNSKVIIYRLNASFLSQKIPELFLFEFFFSTAK